MRYRRLCDVKVTHDFYGTSEIAGFRIWPTSDCKNTLARQQILFRQEDDGFSLLYPSRTDSVEPIPSLADPISFSFHLKADPLWLLITDLPRDKPSFYLLTNLIDNSVNGDPYLGNPTATDTVGEADRLTCFPDCFPIQVPQPSHDHDLRILDILGQEAYAASTEASAGPIKLSPDLTEWTPGKFRFLADDEEFLAFYASSEAVGLNTLGIIELHDGSHVPRDNRLIGDDNTPLAPTFHLRFGRRATTWRFFVVPRSEPDISQESISVVDANSVYTFSNGERSTAPGGESALVFASTAPIPLQSAGITDLRLRKTINGNTTTLIANLPNPRLDAIQQESAQFFSDVYVYV